MQCIIEYNLELWLDAAWHRFYSIYRYIITYSIGWSVIVHGIFEKCEYFILISLNQILKLFYSEFVFFSSKHMYIWSLAPYWNDKNVYEASPALGAILLHVIFYDIRSWSLHFLKIIVQKVEPPKKHHSSI